LIRLDRRLAALAKKRGLSYTRYADDLSFSGDLKRAAASKFRALVTRIVAAEGFAINPDKTRLAGQGNRQTVTGVVVNQVLGLSRQERRRLRAMAHQLRGRNDASQARLEGKIAYLSMLNPQQAAAFRNANG
jgi:retron-type reverse transcriptase